MEGVLFQQLQIFVGDERGNSLTVAADEGTFAGEYGFVDFGSEVVAEFFKSRDIGTSPVSGDSHDWFLSGVCPLAPRIVLVLVPSRGATYIVQQCKVCKKCTLFLLRLRLRFKALPEGCR